MRPKYEREIEEIVSRTWQDGPPSGRVQSPVLEVLPRPAKPPRRLPRLSASSMMIAAIALSVVSYPLQWVYPPAVVAVGLVSVVLFIASIGASVFRWGSSRPTPMWRGRPVETGGSMFGGIARRWRRWRAHRRFRDARWN